MKKKLNVLVLSPHADDAELGMGGTIAKLVKQKNNVTILTAILPKEIYLAELINIWKIKGIKSK